MTIHQLDNSRWDFDTHCYVCDPSNERGLQVPFFHDEDAALVFATFTLDASYSGAPTYVHGGALCAVVDEAAAWAAIVDEGVWAVTQKLTTRFERPVRVDRGLRSLSAP